jgi:predicted DNA-binding ribbon-helix-helix protein
MTSFDLERKALVQLKSIYEERLLNVNKRIAEIDKLEG